MMKDETAGTEITMFVGLRAKCCALRVEHSDKELKKLNTDASSFSTGGRANDRQADRTRARPYVLDQPMVHLHSSHASALAQGNVL
jgi:hypothetical protein